MDDPVRIAAQATIDAIDRQISELATARETLVRMFGMGVRETPLQSPQVAITIPVSPLVAPTPCYTRSTPQVAITAEPCVCQNGSREKGNRERWEGLRQQALRLLAEHGPMPRGVLRQKLGLATRTSCKVLRHPWFVVDERFYSLSPQGQEMANRQKVEVGDGQ